MRKPRYFKDASKVNSNRKYFSKENNFKTKKNLEKYFLKTKNSCSDFVFDIIKNLKSRKKSIDESSALCIYNLILSSYQLGIKTVSAEIQKYAVILHTQDSLHKKITLCMFDIK